jgi:hypothetical protein
MARVIEPLYDHWKPLTQSKFNELILDFEKYCEEGSIVIDKNGVAVPMKLNEAQKAVASLIIPLVFAELPSPTNVFIHKARQEGISTVLMKIEQYCAGRIRNLNTQHMMPTEPDAEEMSEKKFIPALQGLHPELAPTVYPIKRKYKFKDFGGTVLNSSVSFSSAESTGANAGQTNQMAILDEYAKYKRVTHLERGLLATLPKTGRALTVYVSTANGMNHFYDLSKIAKEPNNHWQYLFLPWHMLKEYEMEPQGRLKDLTALTDYELKLCDIFEACGYPIQSWTRKMQFYDYVFQTEAKLDKDYMFENYPSTADESFAASGTPVLPSHVLYAMRDANKQFEYVELVQRDNKISVMGTTVSTIKRYKVPVPGHKYEIWVDPADGGEGGDDSAFNIVDITLMESVCCMKERIDQNDLAETLAPFGYYYNKAEIVIERNTGQSCIDWLVKMLKYPRVRIDPFHTTSRRVEYGVYMTRPVKNEAILRMKFLLNNGFYKDYDPDWIEQGLHFTWSKTPTGMAKAAGTEGYHDDTVMCRLVGVAGLDMRRWKDYKKYIEGQTNGTNRAS